MKQFIAFFSFIILSLVFASGCSKTVDGVKEDSSKAWKTTKEVTNKALETTKKTIHEATE